MQKRLGYLPQRINDKGQMTMDASELLETITNLIQQAEQGEIDPWDVQVVKVIDNFLELMAAEAEKTGHQADLSQSGQAFLSASMLVLYKANTLMQMQTTADEAVVDDTIIDPEDGVLYRTSRLPLEKHLRRRPTAMPPAKRPVTLQELIQQLQVMADQLKLVQQKEKINVPRSKRQPTLQTMRAALELAHQENLTEVAKELEQVLTQKVSELNLKENWFNLEQLVQFWTQTKQQQQEELAHESLNGNLVSVFWALLLLSAQSKVELFQEDFYQDVKVRLLINEVTASATLPQAS